MRLAPDEPDYYSGLVRSMVQEGRLADAQLQLGEWISKDRYPEHAESAHGFEPGCFWIG